MSADTIHIAARHQGRTEAFDFPAAHSIAALSEHIAKLFALDASTVKLIGLTKGKLPDLTSSLSSLSLKNPGDIRIQVLGSHSDSVNELYQHEQRLQQRQHEERLREQQHSETLRMQAQIEAEAREAALERQRRYEAERVERDRQYREQQVKLEAERKEREIVAEQQHEAIAEFSLHAMFGADCEGKQRPGIILPPAVLQRIIDAKVAFPLTFHIQPVAVNNSTNSHHTGTDDMKLSEEAKSRDDDRESKREVFIGVHDFSSPSPDLVLVPRTVLQSLAINEMDRVKLTTVKLPTATAITLIPLPAEPASDSDRPQRSPFLSLSEPERRALLELKLKQRTMIQRNEILSFHYRRDEPEMRFLVSELQPADVASIIDADVEATVAEAATSHEISEEKAEKYQSIAIDDTVEGTLGDGNSEAHYTAELTNANGVYRVELVSVDGDADLFIANGTLVKDATGYPSSSHYDYRSVNDGDDSVTLSNELPNFRVGSVRISVRSYSPSSSYKLTVRRVDRTNSTSTASVNTGDERECPNCHRLIPSRSMALHSVQCARLNGKCPECQTVLLIKQIDKHRAMTHALHPCPHGDCGVLLPLPELNHHRHEQCPYRLVECSYCPLIVNAIDRGEHQAEDGLLRSHCPECQELMQRKLIRRHMRLQHGRDEKSITWRDFFA